MVLAFLIFQQKVSAEGLTIQNLGATISNSSNTQTIQLTYNAMGTTTLSLTPLNVCATNTSDVTKTIPLDSITVRYNGIPLPELQQNIPLAVYERADGIGPISANVELTVDDVLAYAPGTYTLDMTFNIISGGNAYSAPYTLQFTRPVVTSLSSISNVANCKVAAKDVFNQNLDLVNEISTRINITSNSKWKLYLDTNSLGSLNADYYYQISNVSSGVNYYDSTLQKIFPNQNYLIASGGMPANPASYTPENIRINYYLRNPSGNFLKEGTYNNTLIFQLQEDTTP